MAIFQEKYTFTNYAKLHLGQSVASVFDDLVKKWGLFSWEDGLLFQLYPISTGDVLDEEELSNISDLIATMRGEDGTEHFSQADLDDIDWQGTTWYQDKNIIKRVFRTIYFCLNQNNTDLAMDLRFCLDMIVMEKMSELPAEIKEVVSLVYNVLCLYFFRNVPDGVVYYLFESGFVVLAIKLGFKLEDIIREPIDAMVAVDRRSVFCLEMAASLSDNHTSLGNDTGNEVKDVSYWIDNFRIYSQGNFGGSDLLNFAADKNYFGGCSGEDKELIVKILELYTHLVNGFLVVPNGDLGAVEKRLKDLEEKGKAEDPLAYFDDKIFSGDIATVGQNSIVAELPVKEVVSTPVVASDNKKSFDFQIIKKIILSEFGYTKGGQFENIEAVINRLQELAKDYQNPEIADLYYFDEQSGEFKWRE